MFQDAFCFDSWGAVDFLAVERTIWLWKINPLLLRINSTELATSAFSDFRGMYEAKAIEHAALFCIVVL